MQSFVTTVMAMLFLSACATTPGGAGRTSGPLSGHWEGAFASQDIVSAAGRLEPLAQLTVREDGQWTLTGSGTVISGVARQTPTGLVLDGRVTGGDHMTIGRDVSFVLRHGPHDALYGEGQAFYLGHRVDTGLLLAAARR